jgi:hypothetical protein
VFLASLYRVEHEAFTERDAEAFKQLVRVVVRDLLPFVKKAFTNLYSEVKVEQLARSTPSVLWRQQKDPSHTPITPKASMDLHMGVVVDKIAEPLRAVAPDVFEELVVVEQQRMLQVSLNEDRGEGDAEKGEKVGREEEGRSQGEEATALLEEEFKEEHLEEVQEGRIEDEEKLLSHSYSDSPKLQTAS